MKKLLLVVLFLDVLLLQSCSDDPNATGSLFMDPLRIDSIQTMANFDSTILFRIPGTSTTIMTGKYQDYQGLSLMQFSVPAFGSGVILDSATISLRVVYRFKDSTGQFGFSAHAMVRTWTEQSFTWDSVAGSYDPSPIGSYVGTVSTSDSVVRVKIDTATIRRWSQAGSGSVILVPSLTATLVLGFGNNVTLISDSRPELAVSYHDSADTTVVVRQRTTRASFVANSDLPQQAGRFFVGSAISHRGIVRFDSIQIPTNAAITRALLEVSVDPNGSLTNGFTRDSLIVYLLRKNVAPFDSLVLGLVCQPVTVGSQKVFRADIRSIVQLWTTGKEKNYGLLFRPYGEYTTLDRFSLYGVSAAAGLQPKLTITFTELP